MASDKNVSKRMRAAKVSLKTFYKQNKRRRIDDLRLSMNNLFYTISQHLGKVASAVASVALMTSGASPAFAVGRKAKQTVEVVEQTNTFMSLLSNKKNLAAAAGAAYVTVAAAGELFGKEEVAAVETKQDFLEAEPYWDQSTVPVNVYKNKT